MSRKYLILPNAVVLACAIILFQRAFLSGHITWIGSLVTLSPLLPLVYCLAGRMPRWLRYATALLNAILFFSCGYAFIGLANMLIRMKTPGGWPFLLAGGLWLLALGAVFPKSPKANAACAIALNGAYCALGLLGLYARSASAWQPWMTAVLFGALIAAAGLNVCLMVGWTNPKCRLCFEKE